MRKYGKSKKNQTFSGKSEKTSEKSSWKSPYTVRKRKISTIPFSFCELKLLFLLYFFRKIAVKTSLEQWDFKNILFSISVLPPKSVTILHIFCVFFQKTQLFWKNITFRENPSKTAFKSRKTQFLRPQECGY